MRASAHLSVQVSVKMGVSGMFFGLCVILVAFLCAENKAAARRYHLCSDEEPDPATGTPIPFPDICYYFRKHHHGPKHVEETTSAAPATTPTPEQKAAEERKQKIEDIKKLLASFLELEKEPEKKPEVKEPEKPKEEAKGFNNMNEFMSAYMALFSRVFNSW